MLKRLFIALLSGMCCLGSVAAYADAHFVQRPDVQAFITMMVKKHHFDRDELTHLFYDVRLRPRVIQNVRTPLEARPWSSYQLVFIDDSHIRQGVDFWNKNREVLERAERQYGVPASIIVATIGVETKYGKNKGEYPVVDALASIAFSDSSRANYFRKELEEFILLSREQHLDPGNIRGSYAGAIGQPQFMPSSYRRFAVNYSGSGHIDLTNNEDDIIGSIANYYHLHGWQTDQPVAVPTMVEENHYRYLLANSPSRLMTQDDLEEYGLFPYSKLPSNQKFKVISLQGRHGMEYWVGLTNFEVIRRYNPSNLYAMAVYQLSYYIESMREKLNHG